MVNLQKQIEMLNNEMGSQVSPEILSAFERSITDLKKSGIDKTCIGKGMKMPKFTLKSSDGGSVNSDDLLSGRDKVVMAFIRGLWCPYCNLELKALQDSLEKLEKCNAELVAVSPQKSEFSSGMKEKNSLSYDILTDENNLLAKKLGISFCLQDYVKPYYRQLGIDLNEFNGNAMDSLPIPAIYVFDKDHTIIYSFIDANYMNRVSIDELISNLSQV